MTHIANYLGSRTAVVTSFAVPKMVEVLGVVSHKPVTHGIVVLNWEGYYSDDSGRSYCMKTRRHTDRLRGCLVVMFEESSFLLI